MTLEIILRTVFGVREGERLGELREALRDFLDLTTNPRMLLPAAAGRAQAGRASCRSAAASNASTS